VAIEIKSGARWDERDLSGLKSFMAATSNCNAGILGHNGKEAVQLGKNLWALPVSLLLS
jgi:hypothetical protein